MASKIITADECAKDIWALFLKCCDEEDLDEEGRACVLNAFIRSVEMKELKGG